MKSIFEDNNSIIKFLYEISDHKLKLNDNLMDWVLFIKDFVDTNCSKETYDSIILKLKKQFTKLLKNDKQTVNNIIQGIKDAYKNNAKYRKYLENEENKKEKKVNQTPNKKIKYGNKIFVLVSKITSSEQLDCIPINSIIYSQKQDIIYSFSSLNYGRNYDIRSISGGYGSSTLDGLSNELPCYLYIEEDKLSAFKSLCK